MPDNIQSAMFEILKRIQTDVSDVKRDVAELKRDLSEVRIDLAGVKSDMITVKRDVGMGSARLDRLEMLVRRQRRDSAAMLVMMRGTVGIFDERLKHLEDDVQILKERR